MVRELNLCIKSAKRDPRVGINGRTESGSRELQFCVSRALTMLLRHDLRYQVITLALERNHLSHRNIGLRPLDAPSAATRPAVHSAPILCRSPKSSSSAQHSARCLRILTASPWMRLRPFLNVILDHASRWHRGRKSGNSQRIHIRSILTYLSLHTHTVRIIGRRCDTSSIFLMVRKSSPMRTETDFRVLNLRYFRPRPSLSKLSKTGEFCQSNLVFVLDENGNNVFGCRAV